jgi:membrane protein implicated in regulation of membrane protease activity
MSMWYVYGACAVFGGTIMVCQFLLTLLGMGDADHGGVGGHADAGHAGGHDVHADHGHDTHHDHHVSSNWLFGVITFRTVVAALAFFGLAGLAGQSAEYQPFTTLAIALASGVAAMYFVHWMMQSMHRLREDATVRITAAVGQTGAVYLRIPGQRAGAGKVTVTVQGRSMEFQAMTSHDALPNGARVVVTGVLDRETLEVAPAGQA